MLLDSYTIEAIPKKKDTIFNLLTIICFTIQFDSDFSSNNVFISLASEVIAVIYILYAIKN